MYKILIFLFTILYFSSSLADVVIEQSSKFWTSKPNKDLQGKNTQNIENIKLLLFGDRSSLDPVEGFWKNCYLKLPQSSPTDNKCYSISAVVKTSSTEYKVYTIQDLAFASDKRIHKWEYPNLTGTIESTLIRNPKNKFYLEGKTRFEYSKYKNDTYFYSFETRDAVVFFFKRGSKIKKCSREEEGSPLKADTMVICYLDKWGNKGELRDRPFTQKYPPANLFTKIWPIPGKESSISKELIKIQSKANKEKYFKLILLIIFFLGSITLFWMHLKKRKLTEANELKLYNKKHNSKFKKYFDLEVYLQEKEAKKQILENKREEKKYTEEQKKEEIREKNEQRKLEKQELAEQRKLEKQELAEQRKLEKQERSFRGPVHSRELGDESGLMTKIKRLKRLYENGTLSKVEFEKAKNKLLN